MAIITLRESITQAMREEMIRDENVFIMGCDVGLRGNPFGITKGLMKEFGERRVLDTPISEAGFTGLGVGAAIAGMRPLVEILYDDWITLPMDTIVNTAAKTSYMFGGQASVPIVIRAPFGVGGGVAAQHSQNNENWFVHVPGLKVITPSTPYDMKGLLKSAIRDNNPVLCFEHKRNYSLKGEVPDGEYLIPIGKACVRKEGKDCTIVTYSYMTYVAEEAAKDLEKEGISCEIIDLRSLLPLDYDTVMESVAKTSRVVVVTEAPLRGSITGEIVGEIIARGFDLLDAPPERVGSRNSPVPYNEALEALCTPKKEDIAEAVRKTFK
ncbi:alpha-ketoacid dehydrogenase subunit beta [Acetobacterium carbinolicum]|jgi:Pyruvate/2-oxoglutarate dehydrogenase complex, dehydrogenase (E1) component, eukaryotic type, beta subunit|uniref:alpha-ketoacid dehydrogenase subunit beta n=1 Tax=Acetobacterium carbinolicum TaxID=52690 RepID=UPI0039C8EAFC